MTKNITFLLLFSVFTVFTQPITIAVNDLKGDGLTNSELSIFSNRVRTELFNTGKFTVMERGEMDMILKEQEFQQSGACDESSCMVEMGQLLGVSKIVAGNIGKINNFYTISLRIVDVSTGQVDKMISYDFTGFVSDFISKGIKIAAQKLASNENSMINSVEKSNITITTIPPNATAIINDTLELKTPISKELAPGNYNVVFTLDGYQPYNKQFKLVEGANFSKQFRLRPIKKKKRGRATRIISGTIAATALTLGLISNSNVIKYTDEAKSIYNEYGNDPNYNDEYEAAKDNADKYTTTRNILYSISATSIAVFAVSFAF